MVRVYSVVIRPKYQNNKSLIINPFRSLARYASHSGDIAFKDNSETGMKIPPPTMKVSGGLCLGYVCCFRTVSCSLR